MAKKSFLDKISDLTKIAHRANFSSVDKHIANLNFETRFSEMVSTRYTCNSFIDRKINPSKIDKMLKVARRAVPGRLPVHSRMGSHQRRGSGAHA